MPQPKSSMRIGRAALENCIEGDKATFSRTVMAGAEGGSGIDLHRNAAGTTEVAVMGTVQEKTAGSDWRQTFERALHPIALGQGFDAAGVKGLRGAGLAGIGDIGDDRPKPLRFAGFA